MKNLIFLLIIFLSSCGMWGTQKLQTNDSTQNIVQQGHGVVSVEFGFIEQVRQLCQDLNIERDFSSDFFWKQAIADCTFKHLSSMNINPAQLVNFTSQYCQTGADLSALPAAQQDAIHSACLALNPNYIP